MPPLSRHGYMEEGPDGIDGPEPTPPPPPPPPPLKEKKMKGKEKGNAPRFGSFSGQN